MSNLIKKIYFSAGITVYLVKYNFKQKGNIKDKIMATIHGYELSAYLIYKERYGKKYLMCYSDRRRLLKRRLNSNYNVLLDDKYVNYMHFKDDVPLPEPLLVIENGLDLEKKEKLEEYRLEKILAKHQKIIIKPVLGAGGQSVFLIELCDGKVLVNYEESTLSNVLCVLQEGIWFITEFIEQARYAKNIFPFSSNTVRLITLEQNGDVDLVYALHRFGSCPKNPTDNWNQGGISAKVDLESGKLTNSIWDNTGKNIHNHPISGAKMIGVEIPQ